jgi:hypothetical protein
MNSKKLTARSRQAKAKNERLEERKLALETLQRKVEQSRKDKLCYHCRKRPCDLKLYDAGRVTVEACQECIAGWESGDKPLPDLVNSTYTSVAIGGLPSLGKR